MYTLTHNFKAEYFVCRCHCLCSKWPAVGRLHARSPELETAPRSFCPRVVERLVFRVRQSPALPRGPTPCQSCSPEPAPQTAPDHHCPARVSGCSRAPEASYSLNHHLLAVRPTESSPTPLGLSFLCVKLDMIRTGPSSEGRWKEMPPNGGQFEASLA